MKYIFLTENDSIYTKKVLEIEEWYFWNQGYKSFLPFNQEYIFENVLLVVVKIKNDTIKINMKFLR